MPRNKHSEETVQKILDVASKLFREKGYEQTTILDIVDGLGGLTRGAFYYHFKSKEEVLDALQHKRFNESHTFDLIKEFDINGLEKIKKLTTTNFKNQFEKAPDLDLTSATISFLSNPRFLAEHVKENHVISKMLIPLIEEGIEDGSIKVNNPKLLSELIMLLLNFWMIPSIYSSEDEEEILNKFLMIKQVFDSVGLPIIDTDLLEDFNNLQVATKLLQSNPHSKK